MKRGDFWSADMFLVDDINVATTTDHLDSTAMWAMSLCKRLATPSYLASPTKDRLMSSCSIKYRKAYTMKELGWWMTSDFIAKHGDACRPLARACERPDSKWRVLDNTSYDRWRKSKSLAAKVCHVESLRDFQQHIRKCATVDKFATSGGVFSAP